MKRLLTLLFLGTGLLSCQKEVSFDSNGITPNSGNGGTDSPVGHTSYFIRCKIDGSAKSFDYNNRATIVQYQSTKNLSLVASVSSNTSNFESINLGINFQNGAPIAGSYREDYQGTDYKVSGVYNPNSMTTIYGAGSNANTILPLSINITNLTNGIVTGTFQGAFYKQDLLNGGATASDYKTITEGEFNLPVK
jgi:hypothetical protein